MNIDNGDREYPNEPDLDEAEKKIGRPLSLLREIVNSDMAQREFGGKTL